MPLPVINIRIITVVNPSTALPINRLNKVCTLSISDNIKKIMPIKVTICNGAEVKLVKLFNAYLSKDLKFHFVSPYKRGST